MASTAAVTTVRTALGHILGAMQVGRTGASLATTAQDLHIVDKIAFCHNCLYFAHKGSIFSLDWKILVTFASLIHPHF